MVRAGLWLAALCSLTFSAASAAIPPSCDSGAVEYLPCEMQFEWHAGELPPSVSPYRDDVVSVEFRSPSHVTYLMHGFWNGGNEVRVRFTPLEDGVWTYHVSSLIPRFDNREATFNAAPSSQAGFVRVANLRHWRSTNKQPHLWLSVQVPWLELDQTAFENWLDARKRDGFNHIRGVLLTLTGSLKPLTAAGEPDLAYFHALDDRLLAAAMRGFTLDLLLADQSFLRSGAFSTAHHIDPLVRYLIARYGGLNVTWQGIEHFEDVPDSRALLQEVGSLLQRHDAFQHPRSTDARMTSSSLIRDGWMNYAIEASPDPQLGAVERQFLQMPEIHIIQATSPDAFRHELWDSTMNGEYPTVPYAATQSEASMRAVQTWFHVMSGTRHWELDPFFNVTGGRALGLDELSPEIPAVEYIVYCDAPGILELTVAKHKYNPVWTNPSTGEQIPLKDFNGTVFSQHTPDGSQDWIFQLPRNGEKEKMLRMVYFESRDPMVQEVETDTEKIPFAIAEPSGDQIHAGVPVRFEAKITRPNRATRTMQYVWWGEVVATGMPARVLGLGPSGTFTIPKELLRPGAALNVRLLAINANGKAYELDRVYGLTP